MKVGKFYVYKEKINTGVGILVLYTAWNQPKNQARNGFVAEAHTKKELVVWLKKNQDKLRRRYHI